MILQKMKPAKFPDGCSFVVRVGFLRSSHYSRAYTGEKKKRREGGGGGLSSPCLGKCSVLSEMSQSGVAAYIFHS